MIDLRARPGGIATGLLLLASLLGPGTGHRAGAAEPASLIERTWAWGHVIPGPLSGKVPFISDSGSPPFGPAITEVGPATRPPAPGAILEAALSGPLAGCEEIVFV